VRKSLRAWTDLRDRLAEYFQMGARFAKWRAVNAIGPGLPSWGCIEANAHALARYAALCQEAGLVPVVEPEVIMDGDIRWRSVPRLRRSAATLFIDLIAQRSLAGGPSPEAKYGAPGNGLHDSADIGRGSRRHR